MATTDEATSTALAFPLTPITARYQRRYAVPAQDVARHEVELKRYLVLCSKHPSDSLPPTEVLDRLWHEFLLDTRAYKAFCDSLGNGFIHHVPGEPTRSRAVAAERYRTLLALYEEEFHEPPPADVWPRTTSARAKLGDCDADVELGDCNAEGEPESER